MSGGAWPLPPQAARILARVKGGERIQHAARSEGYSSSAVWSWAARDPEFRTRLEHARAVGSPTARRKAAFLNLIASGEEISRAVVRVGVSRRAVYRWRETDPTLAARWDAIQRGHREPVQRARFDAFLRRLASGEDIDAAMDALGYSESTLRYWRSRLPDRWQAIQRAMAAGAALREGRAA